MTSFQELKPTDACYYFSTALNNLESLSKNEILENQQSSNLVNLIWLKIRLNLCLAWSFQEQNLCERAMECVKTAEALSSDPKAMEHRPEGSEVAKDMNTLKAGFLSAKFTINCKACDWEAARLNLRMMIDVLDVASLNTILVSMNTYDNAIGHRDSGEILPFYTILLSRYSTNSGAFTAVRISYLKVLLLSAVEGNNSSSLPEQTDAKLLCDAIVSDHVKHCSPHLKFFCYHLSNS